MQCPRCRKEEATTHPQYGVLIGKTCREKDRNISRKLKRPAEFITQTMTDRITEQRLKYEADILQPWDGKGKPNPDFVKVYKDLAPEYFSREELEKL